MPSPSSGPRSRRDSESTGASSRSKRDEILRTATAYFGENGYEATKLADVAAAVGIGSTALYHYFESKLHCLYVIMADALGFFRSEFDRHTSAHEDYLDALLAVLARVLRPERAGRDAQPGARRRAGTGRRAAGRRLARRRPARSRARGSGTSSSPGRRSSCAAWSRESCPRPIPACSRARCSGSTTASGTGIARAARSAWKR